MSPARPAREWWTAAEIADAGLPDLPGSKRGVQFVAERQGWASDPRRARLRGGKGRAWEYHWTLFPHRAQAALIFSAPRSEAPAKPAGLDRDREEAWAEYARLPASAKDKAAQRLQALDLVAGLEAAGTTRQLAIDEVSRRTGAAPRTIWGWLALVDGLRRDDWLAWLAPRYARGDAASGLRRSEIDPAFGDLIKADYLRLEQPSLTSVYDRCVRIAQAKGIPTVPIHTVRRWIERTVSPTALTLGRKGVEALKRMRPAQERDKTALHAMEAVNSDFHRFDLFVQFPAGPGGQKAEIGRPQMVAMQDIYSGRLLAWRVDRSANSQAVQLCIGDMIERWGIPEHVLLDNGREFAAKTITGGTKTRFRFRVREDDMSGLLTSLGCQIHWATPYSGQSKPIERAFRDLCDRVAKHPAFAGAWTGNRPEAKPENYASAAVPLERFLAVLSEEIELHNARQGRRSETAYGRSFAEVFDESYASAPIRKATAEQRRLWLMGAEGIRANGRTGQVQFMGNRYWADWMSQIAGQRIVARFDRAALWDGLHIYSLADAYLGFAPCLVKAGFFDIDDARSHQKAFKAWKSAQRAELAAHRQLTAADVADELAQLPGTAPARVEATVIRPIFASPKGQARPAPERPDEIEARAAVVADLAARRAPAPEAEEDARQRFIRARDLERKIAEGAIVTKEQRLWLAGYQQTPDYGAWSDMVKDFGEGALG